jgi:Omp85 superfamily domain
MVRIPRTRLVLTLVGTTLLCCALAGPALAGFDEQVDQQASDATSAASMVMPKGNWLPVPIPVANPTLGNGLQAALLYLHPKVPGQEDKPGSTSGVGILATDSKSWAAVVFHDGSLAEDRYRLNAAGGIGEFNLKYYGIGAAALSGGPPIEYKFSVAGGQVRFGARLPGTAHWYAGLTYLLLQSTVTFSGDDLQPGLPHVARDLRTAALGPQITYDSRDSNYFPLKGQYSRASWMNYAPRWGSDVSYDKFDFFYNHYIPLAPRAVLGLRTRVQHGSDETPFFDLPYLDMRGFSRTRYVAENTVSVTAEGRYKFAERWGVMVFAEAGRYADVFSELSNGRTITSYGGGVRWQVTADRDMHLGLDVAISTDDRAAFIQVGERF